MQVVGNRVYVTPIDEKVSDSGLIIELDTTYNQKPINRGIVRFIGDSLDGVKVGDEIMFDHIQAREVEIEGEKLIMMHGTAVYGVISK